MRAQRELLRRVRILGGLADRDLDALPVAARGLRAREVLFRRGQEGASAYILVEGRLKITRDGARGELLLAIVEPVAVLGELALLDGSPRSATVTALASSRVLTVARRDLLAVLRAHPDAALALLGELAARIRALNEALEDSVFLSLRARLARKLLELAGRLGKPASGGGVVLDVLLKQQELGEMVGASRESVNKEIGALARAGVLSMTRGRITVHRPQALAALAAVP